MLPTLFLMTLSAQYRIAEQTEDGIPVQVLVDEAHQMEVRIAASIGHNAYSLRIKGRELLWTPFARFSEAKAKPALFGNPFLAPWANRIDGLSYWVHGRERKLDPAKGNLRLDSNGNPIHGLVLYTDQWKIVERSAGARGARLRSRLEFHRVPDWMAQFPFPHAIEMTYYLSDGQLEILTEIENLGDEPMPVAIGYHPYYRLKGGRDAWTVEIAARQQLELSPRLIPTGRRRAVDRRQLPLKGAQLDDVYTDLIRNERGEAEFGLTNGQQKLTFAFGPQYPVGVIYAPAGREFICFEPMSAITDAFNQHHRGRYADLTFIPAGGRWKESWWIRPSGF